MLVLVISNCRIKYPVYTGFCRNWSSVSCQLVPETGTNSTQLNEHLWTQVLKHLNVHIYLVTIAYQYYNQLISRTYLSPIPVRSAAKSYITSWCIQNLSKCVLNRHTVSTSTTELGRLFQILTIRAEKDYFRVSYIYITSSIRFQKLVPVSGTSWLVPETGTRNRLICHGLKRQVQHNARSDNTGSKGLQLWLSVINNGTVGHLHHTVFWSSFCSAFNVNVFYYCSSIYHDDSTIIRVCAIIVSAL